MQHDTNNPTAYYLSVTQQKHWKKQIQKTAHRTKQTREVSRFRSALFRSALVRNHFGRNIGTVLFSTRTRDWNYQTTTRNNENQNSTYKPAYTHMPYFRIRQGNHWTQHEKHILYIVPGVLDYLFDIWNQKVRRYKICTYDTKLLPIPTIPILALSIPPLNKKHRHVSSRTNIIYEPFLPRGEKQYVLFRPLVCIPYRSVPSPGTFYSAFHRGRFHSQARCVPSGHS